MFVQIMKRLKTAFLGQSIALAAAIVVLLAAGDLFGQTGNLVKGTPMWSRPGYFGMVIGFVGPSHLRTDTITYETDPGFTFGVKFDFRLSRPMYWGVSADVHRIHVRDTGQYLIDVSLNLKRMIFSRYSMVAFRPGVGVGFGYLAQFREYNSTGYLLLKGGLEVLFFGNEKIAYLLEVGVIEAPWGANQDMNFRFGPAFVFRAGLVF